MQTIGKGKGTAALPLEPALESLLQAGVGALLETVLFPHLIAIEMSRRRLSRRRLYLP